MFVRIWGTHYQNRKKGLSSGSGGLFMPVYMRFKGCSGAIQMGMQHYLQATHAQCAVYLFLDLLFSTVSGIVNLVIFAIYSPWCAVYFAGYGAYFKCIQGMRGLFWVYPGGWGPIKEVWGRLTAYILSLSKATFRLIMGVNNHIGDWEPFCNLGVPSWYIKACSSCVIKNSTGIFLFLNIKLLII